MDEKTVAPVKLHRKTIGEEGSRKQTIVVFLLLLFVGLLMYLPGRFRLPPVSLKAPEFGDGEVISIRKRLQKSPSPRPRPSLETMISGQAGQYGIWVKTIDELKEFKTGERLVMTAASVIKLPVLVVYYQAVDKGSLDPEEEYTVSETDRWDYGTGSLRYQEAGTQYRYKEVARLVANQSDNMGMEVLIKRLGGYAKVQQAVKSLGLAQTNLKENEMTTEEAGGLFLQLAQGKFLKPASREELFNNLTNTVNEDRIPAGVPDNVRVIHKFGSEDGVVNDCGIVESADPYVICILTTAVNSGEAETLLVQISGSVWNWLGD